MSDQFYTRLRILFVHAVYMMYSGVLWWRLAGVAQLEYSYTQTIVACSVWSCGYIAFNVLLCIATFKEIPAKKYIKTWLNLPMLMFTLFNLPPYGFTVNQMYKELKLHTIGHDSLPMGDYVLLQMVMPVLLVTFIVHPLPRRAYSTSEYLAVALEFMNAFDIMDLVSDLNFVQTYSDFWFVLYFVSLGVAALLLSFPVKIDSNDILWPQKFTLTIDSIHSSTNSIIDAPAIFEIKDNLDGAEQNSGKVKFSIDGTDEVFEAGNPGSVTIEDGRTSAMKMQSKVEDEVTAKKASVQSRYTFKIVLKICKAALTLIFVDVCFATIRFKVMVQENSAEHGFNMIVKNFILFGLHSCFLIKHLLVLVKVHLNK